MNWIIDYEIFGLTGGALFLFSWLLQAWESKRAGSPTVSVRFFVIRALASALLAVEAAFLGSVSLLFVMLLTLAMMLYNIHLARRQA
ncbi:hypothetical protein [Oceanomicrobium pacificus]|uniref:Lipid A biosynthesis N-terminal domain-containing protein n=1 Tax=Oceanomicrobium pacificus TaxID=2692916 RepID=A0A6B0TV87_9RHOB|nr:hypothetical protein [Oceanomicrobium pacificus]MXU65132.1 hypothetical protein [Oceanomicrobium pacificus]